MRPTVRWRACSKSSCVSRPYPARDLILRATYFLCLIAVDAVGKHDFGRDILPHRESEVAKQSAVQGSLPMPVVQNGEDLWATLFVLNNAVIPDTISLTLPPNPALPPSAAALEHKGQDRLTPCGVWQVSLLPRALLLASRNEIRLTVMETHRGQRRWLATIDSGGGGLRPP